MKISLAEINSKVGDLKYNANLIKKHAVIAIKNGAEILITPELSLCGYPPEDLLLETEFIDRCRHYLIEIAEKFPKLKIIVGHPRRKNKLLFNSISLLYSGKINKVYDKQKLPNYGVFDERRYFSPSKKPGVFKHKGKIFGLLICEDIWEEGPLEELSKLNVDYVVCVNASPYEFNKTKSKFNFIQNRLNALNDFTLIYLNCVGGQDELLFDGNSFITKPKKYSPNNLPFFSGQFNSQNIIADFSKNNHMQITRKFEKFPFHRKILEDPIKQINPMNKEKFLIYNLLNGLILAMKDYIEKNSINKLFLGLSGGIDSAVVLFIASKVISREKITAIMMPSEFTSDVSLKDAKKLASNLGVNYKNISIQKHIKNFEVTFKKDFEGLEKDITEQNIQARIRGMILMAYANKFDGMVLATGNKSEMAVGYSTIYGDMVGGFSILKDVPKTMVYKIANEINYKENIIPQRIIDRAPSAELTENQLDEDSLPSYEILDKVIDLHIEKNFSEKDLIKFGFSTKLVKKVVKLIKINEFKRRQSAPGPKITSKAFTKDRRYPITNRFQL
ncbi:NAD+ synthase [Methylophilaceae bacterium]|nr:NAD+ synthase [Methylophilaceae bacterium]